MEITKQELRKHIAVEKQKYRAEEFSNLSGSIIERLEKHPAFERAEVVCIYYAMEDEVDTRSLIQKWHNEKLFLLPSIHNGDIRLKPFEGTDSMKESTFHILEPKGSNWFDYMDEIDLIIVPGIAFDDKCNRLGHGKGYYDRFLKRVKAYKIGICFPFQIVKQVPHNECDYKVDEVFY